MIIVSIVLFILVLSIITALLVNAVKLKEHLGFTYHRPDIVINRKDPGYAYEKLLRNQQLTQKRFKSYVWFLYISCSALLLLTAIFILLSTSLANMMISTLILTIAILAYTAVILSINKPNRHLKTFGYLCSIVLTSCCIYSVFVFYDAYPDPWKNIFIHILVAAVFCSYFIAMCILNSVDTQLQTLEKKIKLEKSRLETADVLSDGHWDEAKNKNGSS